MLEPPCSDVSAMSRATLVLYVCCKAQALRPGPSGPSMSECTTQASVGFTLLTPTWQIPAKGCSVMLDCWSCRGTVNQGCESAAGNPTSLFTVWTVVKKAGFSKNWCWKFTFCHDVWSPPVRGPAAREAIRQCHVMQAYSRLLPSRAY